MPLPLVDDSDTKKKGKKNPLSELFDNLRMKQEKINEIAGDKEEVRIKVADLNYLFNEMLKIDKHLKTKPLTLPEVYEWGNNILEVTPMVTIRETKEMWKYDGDKGKYIPDGDTYLQSLCANKETGGPRAIVPDILRKLTMKVQGDSFKSTDEFENPPHLINMKNGVFDIKEKKLIDHSAEYYFTYILDVAYDPNATCPKFEQTMKDLLKNEDDYMVLQKWTGNHFWKFQREQKSLFLFGPSMAGKSETYFNILADLLGQDNFCSHAIQDFNNPNTYATADLYCKLANVCADMTSMPVKDISIFKQLTGNDYVNARTLYQKPFKFKNYAKLSFGCNKLPYVKDEILEDPAFIRRVMLLETKIGYKVPNKDIYLELKAELPGIFNWAIQGLGNLLNDNTFGYNKDVVSLWKDNMDMSYDSTNNSRYYAGPTEAPPSASPSGEMSYEEKKRFDIYRRK